MEATTEAAQTVTSNIISKVHDNALAICIFVVMLFIILFLTFKKPSSAKKSEAAPEEGVDMEEFKSLISEINTNSK